MCIRCGDIFNAAFIARMSSFARKSDLSEQTQSLLMVMHSEALLGCSDAPKLHEPVHTEHHLPDDDTKDEPVAKRLCRSDSIEDTTKPCCESSLSNNSVTNAYVTNDAEMTLPITCTPYSRGPMFYYCLHRRCLKNVNLPK